MLIPQRGFYQKQLLINSSWRMWSTGMLNNEVNCTRMPTYPYIISILYYINQAYITAQSDYSGVSWAVKSAAVNLNFAIESISIESLTIKKSLV